MSTLAYGASRAPFLILATLLLFLLPFLAGCLESSDAPQTASTDAPIVVTNPGDFSSIENASMDDDRAHLHDYWGGKKSLEIVSETQSTGGMWFGDPISWALFTPPPGKVFPLGTGIVRVTVSWTEESTDWYANPELWVKTQEDNAPRKLADLASGDTIELPTTNAMNDLPHQTVSAWEFHFYLTRPDEVRPLTFRGDVTMTVVAEKTLDIPLFPAHPDHWAGATEIALLDDGQDTFYQGNSNRGWSCFYGCPHAFRPMDGALVPFDAKLVRVTLTAGVGAPTKLGLSWHGADTREFTRMPPTSESGTTRVYDIPVERGVGDGPYALQSLWEFLPYIESPQEDGVHKDTYSISAVALKNA